MRVHVFIWVVVPVYSRQATNSLSELVTVIIYAEYELSCTLSPICLNVFGFIKEFRSSGI